MQIMYLISRNTTEVIAACFFLTPIDTVFKIIYSKMIYFFFLSNLECFIETDTKTCRMLILLNLSSLYRLVVLNMQYVNKIMRNIYTKCTLSCISLA